MGSINYYKSALKVLEQLHKDHPSFSIARHIATATADYGDIWGMSNKEFLFSLEKYQAELELDSDNIANEGYIEQITKDAENLLNNNEDENDDFE